MTPIHSDCVFCRIVAGTIPTEVIAEDENTVVFLDQSPGLPRTQLIVPRRPLQTLTHLPDHLLAPFFTQVRRATRAVEAALEAEGSFVAQNNKISQTVPHLHFHVIPRKKRDGMRGFFWPRRPYTDDTHRSDTVSRLRQAFRTL